MRRKDSIFCKNNLRLLKAMNKKADVQNGKGIDYNVYEHIDTSI